MKDYFTIYLPVKEEIRNGDKATYSIRFGNINKFPDGITNAHLHQEDGNKAVKLFLCSRDIQVGDKFRSKDLVEHKCRNIFEFEKHSIEDDNGLSHMVENCFKVIGEISPEALSYVKEGDEFDEEEVGFVSFDGKDWFFTERAWTKLDTNTYPKTIKIKGPCGHFH